MHGSPIEIFYSYTPKDASFRAALEKHLSLLHRQGLITTWYDRLIVPGTDWKQAVDTHLERASIILLLISADFLASDYCYGKEMQRALELHQALRTRVIPILLRPVVWQDAPFAHLQVLPSNMKAITTWKNRDAAFVNVAASLRRAIEGLSLSETSASRAVLPAIWNIPYPRNFFFLGREDIFSQLRAQLLADQPTALSQPQAISGLGGIGKTQIAIEYAYRNYQSYQAVLWVRAESVEALVSSYVSLARLLVLPEREARDQIITVQAVKTWLQTHHQWLLILDNADDLSLIPDFLPTPQLGGGHLLLTTRAQSLGGLANRIEVDTLDQMSGILLLLRRSGLLALGSPLDLAKDEDRLLAEQIWQELDGLPLAIDQAGAYLEETHCSLIDYVYLLHTQKTSLLKQRGGLVPNHPDSVYTTFTLAINAATRYDAAAVDLLKVCALLYPDAMPEELFRQGASYLGQNLVIASADLLTWNKLLATVCAYSLLQRQPGEQTLSIHRLAQAVLQEHMLELEHRQWIHSIINALEAVFPQSELTSWRSCERLISHVLRCVEQALHWEHTSLELASLLCKAADYLSDRAQYKQAEPLYERALLIRENALGPMHPEITDPLHHLGLLYREQGRYAEAKALYERALRIREQTLGLEHPQVAALLNDLADLYNSQRKYKEAELLYERTIYIQEQSLGLEHPQLAFSLHGLANLYVGQGMYTKAELLFQRAIHIRERMLGLEHPQLAYSLNDLADLYNDLGEYTKAELLFRQALIICERTLGPEHPQLAFSLNGLGEVYREQGKYGEAELLHRRALQIREQVLGPAHPRVTYSLHALADLYKEQGKYEEAELLYQRALRIREQIPGYEHPDIAYSLYKLANLYIEQQQYEKAEPLYKRALQVWQTTFGSDHFQMAYAFHGLANLYSRQEKYEQAELLYQRALHIWESIFGSSHFLVADVLHDFAKSQKLQDKDENARSMYQIALNIRKRVFGENHRKTLQTLECLEYT